MEKIKVKLETEESKERWKFIEKVSKEVDSWPDWKKAEARMLFDYEPYRFWWE